ncbi:AMP-binding protein [Anaeromyxobacter sp. SG26]|uniref:AMP-binding protein n=1 Tax=Anaeromyxobacter sp. SG26 TaxID=2925407 RepID=UPI001F593B2C|nr:AMP-binding protein [Anaeromyxobacter sp. SG26]
MRRTDAPSENLFDVLTERGRADATFIETDGGRRLTYAELRSLTGRYANALAAHGVEPGDRVAVQVEKSPEAYCLYLAVLRRGGIYVPLNPAYTVAELRYFLEDAAPAAFVFDPADAAGKAPLAAACGVPACLTLDAAGKGTLAERAAAEDDAFPTAPRGRDDVAAILYTSGTTGRQKGAMLTHGNLASNARALTNLWGFTERDRLLHALPMFHAHGLFIAAHCALLSGSAMLFLARFSAERVAELLPRATAMMGVPTFYTRLLDLPGFGPEACRSVRLFTSGSAPLLAETSRAFAERTGHAVLERYGMTEAVVITSNPLDGERRPGSVGRPIEGVELRVADAEGRPLSRGAVGVLQIRGPAVMKGYWRQPEKTAEAFTADGWFRTGDLGTVAEDGYVTLVGRTSDLVISGGFNVYPKEVELALDALPGVVESAVIGVPHRDLGEAVTAVVVRRDPALDAGRIVGALKARLASYKVPKHVHFVDHLPRNAMGKVLKSALRETYAVEASRPVVPTH